MNEDLTFKKGQFGYIEYKSSNPFEFHQIIKDYKNSPPQDAKGWLLFPEKFSGKLSCMVCVHHSGGWGGAQYQMMIQLLEAGYAVFQVDSFDARGVTSTTEDQLSVTYAMLMADAYEALKFLSRHPDIDKKKIGICGWSLGGAASLYSAWVPLAEKLAPDGERFALHLNYYPLAIYWPEEMRWSDSPILNLLGGKDDYTPFSLAQRLTEGIKGEGGDCRYILYEEGLHGFDSVMPKTFWPDSIVPNTEKFARIDKEGDITYETDDGEILPGNTMEDRIVLFEKIAALGAWTGGNWDIRKAAKKDAFEFIEKFL